MLITSKAKGIKGNRSAYLSKSLCPSKPFRCNIYYEYSTWIILCTLSMVKNYYISKVNSQSIPKILNFVLLKNKELTAYPANFYLCSFLINKYEWLNSLLGVGESPPHHQVAHPIHQILFSFPPNHTNHTKSQCHHHQIPMFKLWPNKNVIFSCSDCSHWEGNLSQTPLTTILED